MLNLSYLYDQLYKNFKSIRTKITKKKKSQKKKKKRKKKKFINENEISHTLKRV